MRPNIGAIVIHEDCDIADHANRPFGAILPQRAPLFIKGKLKSASNLDVVRQFLTSLLQRCRLAMREISWPLVPTHKFLSGTKRVEQNEVIQPPMILGTESIQSAAETARSCAQEIPRRLKEQWHFLSRRPGRIPRGRKQTKAR